MNLFSLAMLLFVVFLPMFVIFGLSVVDSRMKLSETQKGLLLYSLSGSVVVFALSLVGYV